MFLGRALRGRTEHTPLANVSYRGSAARRGKGNTAGVVTQFVGDRVNVVGDALTCARLRARRSPRRRGRREPARRVRRLGRHRPHRDGRRRARRRYQRRFRYRTDEKKAGALMRRRRPCAGDRRASRGSARTSRRTRETSPRLGDDDDGTAWAGPRRSALSFAARNDSGAHKPGTHAAVTSAFSMGRSARDRTGIAVSGRTSAGVVVEGLIAVQQANARFFAEPRSGPSDMWCARHLERRWHPVLWSLHHHDDGWLVGDLASASPGGWCRRRRIAGTLCLLAGSCDRLRWLGKKMTR